MGTFEKIFDAVPDGLLVADRDGIIRYTNIALETLFGYGPGELCD